MYRYAFSFVAFFWVCVWSTQIIPNCLRNINATFCLFPCDWMCFVGNTNSSIVSIWCHDSLFCSIAHTHTLLNRLTHIIAAQRKKKYALAQPNKRVNHSLLLFDIKNGSWGIQIPQSSRIAFDWLEQSEQNYKITTTAKWNWTAHWMDTKKSVVKISIWFESDEIHQTM